MKFITVKTRPMVPPKDNLIKILDEYLPRLKERDIVVITSKVLGIHQGRCVKIGPGTDKAQLIRKEADFYLPKKHSGLSLVKLTIKDNTLIPTAGIDESNGNGYYVLWPKNVNRLLGKIWRHLRRRHRVKELGIISTDSHTVPLRYGVIGVSTGFFGIEPIIDHRGKPDIFGRKLKLTRTNVVDALSAMAVLLMGESHETTPLLIIRGAKFAQFSRRSTYQKIVIPRRIDNYSPLLKIFRKPRQKTTGTRDDLLDRQPKSHLHCQMH